MRTQEDHMTNGRLVGETFEIEDAQGSSTHIHRGLSPFIY